MLTFEIRNGPNKDIKIFALPEYNKVIYPWRRKIKGSWWAHLLAPFGGVQCSGETLLAKIVTCCKSQTGYSIFQTRPASQ